MDVVGIDNVQTIHSLAIELQDANAFVVQGDRGIVLGPLFLGASVAVGATTVAASAASLAVALAAAGSPHVVAAGP